VQKTATFISRAVKLFSAFKMVFSSFLARIPVSSNKLLTNRKKLVVDKVSLFRKGVIFSETHGKDWEDSMRKCGTPDSHCWQFSNTLAYFHRFFSLSVDLTPGVGFGQTWYFRKSYDVYFPMTQTLCHFEFRLRNYKFRNKGCRRDFLVGSPFFGSDSGQLGNAFDKPKEPASR
jgi:hypothetical protein